MTLDPELAVRLEEEIVARELPAEQQAAEIALVPKVISMCEMVVGLVNSNCPDTQALYHARYAVHNVLNWLPSKWVYEYEAFFNMLGCRKLGLGETE